MIVAEVILVLLTVYAAAGLLFALLFVWRGVKRVDPNALHASIGFHLVIIPGCAALWPWMATKWIKASESPPAVGSRTAEPQM